MQLFDTHCHLDAPAFAGDRGDVLRRTRAAGVRDLLIPGVSAAAWDAQLALCEQEPGLYPALGLHPYFLPQHGAGDVERLASYLSRPGVIAVGEIGLDFQIQQPDRPRQLALFRAQLELAATAGLPVVLHVRKAHDQVIQCLRRQRVPGGTIHAFNGSLQQAHQYLDLGFALGFGGMLTFTRSTRLRVLARDLPLEGIVLETDAPDMTVASHRGQRNSPEYLPEILQVLAELRGLPGERLAEATRLNAKRLFRLP